MSSFEIFKALPDDKIDAAFFQALATDKERERERGNYDSSDLSNLKARRSMVNGGTLFLLGMSC